MREKANVILEQSYINNASPSYLFFKRFFDIAVSLLMILLLSPVLLITSLWIKFRLKEAVLSREVKYGLKGRIFHTCEFSAIKNTTIRNLPLLFNVLKGNMSFVGPQPASAEDITYVTWYSLKLSAKPGITGLWQINRKIGGLGAMARMDLKYIRERCLLADMKILMKSICLLFQRREHWKNDNHFKDR